MKILQGILIIAVLAAARIPSASADTWVFVHGAWGGGWDWKTVTSQLEKQGHVAYRPSLTGLGTRAHLASPATSLTTHIEDIVTLIEIEQLTDIVLVGHSYGGMVITGVADRVADRIKRLVYVDAIVPVDGDSMMSLRPENAQKWMELAESKGDGWRIPPWWKNPGRDTAQPMATFTQAITLSNAERETLPAHYILTIEPGKTWDRFSKFAKRAEQREWPVSTLATGHNPQRTMPDELIRLLLSEPAWAEVD